MRNLKILLVVLSLTGCVTAPRSQTNELSLGMSKQQVVNLMGTPDSTSASKAKGKCLMYSKWRDFWNRRPGDYSDRYYACFKDSQLSSYGRVGDPE